jgi:hypothetical protein
MLSVPKRVDIASAATGATAESNRGKAAAAMRVVMRLSSSVGRPRDTIPGRGPRKQKPAAAGLRSLTFARLPVGDVGAPSTAGVSSLTSESEPRIPATRSRRSLRTIERIPASGTEGSNPACSSGESHKLDHRDRTASHSKTAVYTCRYSLPSSQLCRC